MSAEQVGVTLAQHILLHFAHSVARQVIDENDAPRLLEPREALAQSRENSLVIDGRAPLFDDDCSDAFAEVGMG